MFVNNAYNQYIENSVYTASPAELTLMLYNGLVKFIMQGQAAIQNNKLEKSHESIVKAQAILQEFQASLDHNYEVAEYLNLMYDYMHRRLIEANIKKDSEILEEVLGYAKELRDTWEKAMKLSKNGPKAAEPMSSIAK